MNIMVCCCYFVIRGNVLHWSGDGSASYSCCTIAAKVLFGAIFSCIIYRGSPIAYTHHSISFRVKLCVIVSITCNQN
uniref:Uncharacterized protein n=1 Tax=Arundo donax TaxID=35708 RepID=A0A0A8ZZA2_ARUDO